MKLEHDGWVVLADGRRAVLTRNIGTAFEPKLEVHSVLEAEPNPPTREQGTDRPGRSHESTSPRSSAMEQTDWHAQAEAEFLNDVAGRLDQLCTSGELGSLVLVAPPRALAELRRVLAASVRNRTVAEIDKDLTNHRLPDVEKVLTSL
jgi:protein required for attachment to host cells